MKKMLKSLVPVVLLALSFSLFGCSGDSNTSDYSKTGTLQGKIIDATTGKAVAFDPATYKPANVKMYLIRGVQNQQPAKYVFDSTDTVFAGEYAFTNIPYVTAAADATYKLVIDVVGYQRFETELNFLAGATIDTTLNRIGNIYLFPVGATAADYTVKVRYNNAAVPGATVQLVQNVANNTTNVGANTNRLNPSIGLLPVLSATTDASGNAVFAGTNLVLGGRYTPVVLPVKATANAASGAQADQLEQKTGDAFNVGAALTPAVAPNPGPPATPGTPVVLGTEQTISMVGANNSDSSLFITKISNSTLGILADAGDLTITFNRPVLLNNVDRAVDTISIDNITGLPATAAATSITTTNTVYGFGATLASSSLLQAAKLTAFGATADIRPIVATLDATKTILTLTPKFSVAKGAGDFDLQINYFDTPRGANLPAPVTTTTTAVPAVTTTVRFVSGGLAASVSPLDKPALEYGIFAANPNSLLQVKRNGSAVGSTVFITGPQ